MLNQVVRAIEPHLSLAEVIDQWNQISKSLSEPSRRRLTQIAERFIGEPQQVSAYGGRGRWGRQRRAYSACQQETSDKRLGDPDDRINRAAAGI